MRSVIRTDRAFIGRILLIAVPIMIQNGITNFVSMLDNIMVGRIGTDPMSGVAVVNELIFVWMIAIFGGLSGIGIFTSQYTGKGDTENVRNTFRLQLYLALILTAAGIVLLLSFGHQLISLFLTEDGGVGNAEETLRFAMQYLGVMYFGFLPFALTQAYAGTLRAYGETVVPMTASIIAVFVNLIGNYILIYGKCGAPKLGVAGAALATVLSRFVELFAVMLWTHLHHASFPFAAGVWKSVHVPIILIRECFIKGMPLLVNEALWSGGQAFLTQIYSLRGLSVIAAFNIARTIANVFNVAFIAMGSATGIIMGQELGKAGGENREELVRDAWSLTFFSVILCVISGAVLASVSHLFPMIYNTSGEIRTLAASLIIIYAVCMPIHAFANASYFIIRSGGRTFITFIFDSCFEWLLSIPVAFSLAHFTGLPIIPLFLAVQLVELIKCAIGAILMQKGIWIRDITV